MSAAAGRPAPSRIFLLLPVAVVSDRRRSFALEQSGGRGYNFKMSLYDPKSPRADEFINHQEILETLAFAQEHKRDEALIDSILKKAKPRRDESGFHCPGLSHREASVLLACDIPQKTEEMFTLAEEIKQVWILHDNSHKTIP